MYTAFFGLQRDPFTISPDPRFLFLSERHREALAHLLYGAQGAGGFVLLTGDVGAGKTTVCRRFLDEAPSRSRLAYIFNPRLSVTELLQSVADEFGYAVPSAEGREPTVKELVDPLNQFLLDAHASRHNPILIIDEAQNLSPDVLEQLRLLTNLETNERKLLQIVLIGQPELREILARPGLEQLAQRIVARFHLGPLDPADTTRYIRHRLKVAGHQGPLPFEAGALRRIHQRTAGVPRRINLLCGRAMLGAYAQGRRTIDTATVDRAAAEVFGDSPPAVSRSRTVALLGLGVLAGVAISVAAFLALRPATPVAAAAAAPASVATSLPAPPAPALTPPPPSPPPAPPRATDLIAKEDAGWRAIGPRWGLPADTGQPCATALELGLQCYRTSRMTWHGMRQMDRPALLRLQLPDGNGYAVLEGMSGDRVRLAAGEHRWDLDTSALAKVWRGDYLTLWRTPPGQRGSLSDGMRGSAARWTDNRLLALQQRGALDAAADSLARRVEAFQRANGLDVDGRASPTTLILLNRASGIDEPRLTTVLP